MVRYWILFLPILFGINPSQVLAESLFSQCQDELDCIVERHIVESGGHDALLNLKSISRFGTIEFFNENHPGPIGKFQYHTDIIYPRKLREELRNDKILVDRGTNGEKYWEWTGSKYELVSDIEKQKSMSETAERANRDILWLTEEIKDMKRAQHTPSWAGKDLCLEGVKERVVIFVCFDRQTGFLSAKGNDEEYRLFSEWTRVKSVQLPFRLTHFRQMKPAYEIILNQVDIDRVINSLRFDPPASP